MTRIKICGVTNIEDARDAVLLGADAIGLNFHERSPRCVTATRAAKIIESLPPFAAAVGIFVNHPDPHGLEDFALSIGLNGVQLHGNETTDYCSLIHRVKVIRALRVDRAFRVETLRGYEVDAFLLDAYVPGESGGTGQVFDWSRAFGANAFGSIILAGGLTADNVGDAIRQLHPYAVDVASSVEREPGRKDYDKMASFIETVRRTDVELMGAA